MTAAPGGALDRAYRAGVAVKGIDGAFELISGLALWLAPGVLEALLRPLSGQVDGDHPVRNFVAYWAGRMDRDLSAGPHVFVILFLLAHGVVKLALVYCLFKEYEWAYPYAIGVLVLFAVYQVYVLATSPSIGMLVLTVLDAGIIYLVAREWRQLKRRRVSTLSRPGL